MNSSKQLAFKSMEKFDRKEDLVFLLRRIADLLEKNRATEIEELFSNVVITVGRTRQQKKPPSTKSKSHEYAGNSWEAVTVHLASLETRDEGNRHLKDLDLTRANLESLARFMNLPVTKHDPVERIRDKIVESSIGSRLNSRAIRGDFDRK
jgi:hypothetical protein